MKKLLTCEGERLLSEIEKAKKNCCMETIIPHNVYPRPTLERDSFLNLNGFWDFGTCDIDESPEFDKKILVPFPVESQLSLVEKHYKDQTELHYKRTFILDNSFIKDRVIIHFGAVDQHCTVYINGKEAGYNSGGYSPFSFDITESVHEGENEIHVRVVDNLNSKIYPYGKQREKRGGMWYTPVSGIWQTVWIESVFEKHIKNIEFKTEGNYVTVFINDSLSGECIIETEKDNVVFSIKEGCGKAFIEAPVFWSPENPFLYYVTVKTEKDIVKSYFAFRTLEIKEVDGVKRLLLNGKPYFFHGMLDQGYWSDGIYTPAEDEYFVNDIILAKNLGFNMLRKHIKTEPERFYYYCDKLGMVVFQDMINNSDYSFIRDTALPTIGLKRKNDKNMHKNPRSREAFAKTTERVISDLKKHPCICLWTIFNEGWGQFQGEIMYDFVKSLDDTRFVDTASGWFRIEKSDVESLHTYFKKYVHKKSNKPVFLSEFGGYSYKIQEHSFNLKKTYGYGKFSTEKDFTNAVENLYVNEIIPSIKDGLCATVYTQLSDVEDETNGFITYDRKVLKISSERMKMIKEKIYNELDMKI